MQQMGSAQKAGSDDLEKPLAASEEKAWINQMVHDHEERGVSTFHQNCHHMTHIFESIILPHITHRAIRVYYENLD